MRGHIVKVTTGGRSLEEYLRLQSDRDRALKRTLASILTVCVFHRCRMDEMFLEAVA